MFSNKLSVFTSAKNGTDLNRTELSTIAETLKSPNELQTAVQTVLSNLQSGDQICVYRTLFAEKVLLERSECFRDLSRTVLFPLTKSFLTYKGSFDPVYGDFFTRKVRNLASDCLRLYTNDSKPTTPVLKGGGSQTVFSAPQTQKPKRADDSNLFVSRLRSLVDANLGAPPKRKSRVKTALAQAGTALVVDDRLVTALLEDFRTEPERLLEELDDVLTSTKREKEACRLADLLSRLFATPAFATAFVAKIPFAAVEKLKSTVVHMASAVVKLKKVLETYAPKTASLEQLFN